MTKPSFCQDVIGLEQPDTKLDTSAKLFLDHLGLLVHPLCSDDTTQELVDTTINEKLNNIDNLTIIGQGVFELPSMNLNTQSSIQIANKLPQPPIIDSISLLELHDNSYYQLLLTASTMSAPTIAMMELWLRFFAVFICPVCICWLLHREITKTTNIRYTKDIAKKQYRKEKTTILVSIMGLASSAVLFTDSLYVYEYGRYLGLSYFILASILTLLCVKDVKKNEHERGASKVKVGQNIPLLSRGILFQWVVTLLIGLTLTVFLRSDGGDMMERLLPSTLTKQHQRPNTGNNPLHHMPNPGIDLPTINEGLYHSSNNPYISTIVKHWPVQSRTYNVKNGATPYLVNGDQRTGIPFIVNKVEEQEHVRVWVQNPYDLEYVALDIAFGSTTDNGSTKFVHDVDKPVYLILHGLNGGSHEEYVKDFVKRRRSEGSTCVVMIARGMMDTNVIGWNVFHGARTGDVDVSARALRRGLISLADAHEDIEQRPVLVGVGYSMGAIILSNYVARSGKHCALDAATAVSGGLDMRQNLNFKRSMRLWQPMLTFGLREDILIGKFARHYKHRLTKQQFLSLLRVTSISALDVEAIVTYNSYDNLVHYYSEMSAMGDRDPEFELFEESNPPASWGRIANVSIPFAVLQALDDPLVGWRTIGTNDPQGLAESGSGNVILLLTKGGGHVGWPLGNNPATNSWKWMNDAARDFALTVDIAKREIEK